MSYGKLKLHLIDEDGLNHRLNEKPLSLSTQYSRLPIYRFSISLPKNVDWRYSGNRVNLIFANQKISLKACSGLALWAKKHYKEKKKITSDIRIENSQLFGRGRF